MSELPDPDANRAGGTFKSGNVSSRITRARERLVRWRQELNPPYRHPQVIVVSDDERPRMIVGTERNTSGGLFHLIPHRLRVLGPEHGKFCIVLLNTQGEEVPMK